MISLRRGGGYAEYAIVLESEAARKPTEATHAEAAAVPLVALTAWQALFEEADLQAGQTVLIHAGAGGVGSVAVQLAAWKGATVIATASPRNHEFLRSIGADVVLDPIGGQTQVRSLAVLKEGGILVSIVGLTAAARSPQRDVRARGILVQPDGTTLQQIADLIDEGYLQPIVTHVFPLEEAPEAHRQSETRHTRGKIVFQIVPPR
jgi:NADPH:quinone reductase-like Zn-dependent oxidoreductase